MAKRTVEFAQIPWDGGINTSVDPGMLGPNDLSQHDNGQYDSTGVRKKREGIDYFDTDIPAVASRSSNGTTRTLVFASSISLTLPTDQLLVVGESITVTGAGNTIYNCTAGTISAIVTTSVADDTIEYTFTGATSVTETDTPDTAAEVERSSKILAAQDVWFYDTANTVKAQMAFYVTEHGLMFKNDAAGRRTEITKAAAATALTVPLSAVDLRLYNNKLFITMDGINNTPKMFDPNAVAVEWENAPGSPPNASIMGEYLGRLLMNEKTNPDRLHFCETGDHTKWQGVGDSGAIDINYNDNDASGISAICPAFRNRLIIGKGSKIRQVLGDSPETLQVVGTSEGLGIVSHKAVSIVDLDDLYFPSIRGIHSMNATDTQGDFESNFASKMIQPTFRSWASGRLKYMQSVYVPSLNSIAYAVSEEGESQHSALWLYNIETQKWSRWPGINAQCVALRQVSGADRLMLGLDNGRLAIAQNGTFTDYDSEGITYRLKTGMIYPDNNPLTDKGFKRLWLFFKPKGDFSFTCYFKVDDFAAQPLVFSQTTGGAILGTSFILGVSTLATTSSMTPVGKDVVGYGKGFSLEIFQSGTEAQVEIYGYIVEYEPAGIALDSRTS